LQHRKIKIEIRIIQIDPTKRWTIKYGAVIEIINPSIVGCYNPYCE
jgi:hypothetical protein